MYADDTQLYFSFKASDTASAVQTINRELDRVALWSNNNTLLLNPNKSKFIIMGSRQQVSAILSANPEIKIMGNKVERVLVANNLGLITDQELRFEDHVNRLAKNCFYRLKILYRIRNFISVAMRIKLVDTLVLSKFNYCDAVYGPCLLSRTERLIQRVQNACARYCFSIPRRNHVTPFLNKNNMIKMAARRKAHLASLLFGIIKTQQPKYLFSKLGWRQDSYNYMPRSMSNPLSVPKFKTTAFRGCFKYAATRCWNDLPPPLRILKRIETFKLHYKKYLLREQKLIESIQFR